MKKGDKIEALTDRVHLTRGHLYEVQWFNPQYDQNGNALETGMVAVINDNSQTKVYSTKNFIEQRKELIGTIYRWALDKTYPGTVYKVEAGPENWRYVATWNEAENTLMFVRLNNEEDSFYLFETKQYVKLPVVGDRGQEERQMTFEDCDLMLAAWCVEYQIEVLPKYLI